MWVEPPQSVGDLEKLQGYYILTDSIHALIANVISPIGDCKHYVLTQFHIIQQSRLQISFYLVWF